MEKETDENLEKLGKALLVLVAAGAALYFLVPLNTISHLIMYLIHALRFL